MASRQELARNNVRAGIFVTVALLLAFGVIAVLSDSGQYFRPWARYGVRFSVSSGVTGLSKGSEVQVGGLRRGWVRDVEPAFTDGNLTGIVATIELDPSITLYTNAVAVRVGSLLGNIASINFPSVGDPQGGKPLARGDIIDAVDAQGLLATLLGPKNANRASNIVENVDGIVSSVRKDYDEYLRPTFADARETVADARDIARQFREATPEWTAKVTAVLEKANQLGDTLLEAAGEAKVVVSDVHAMLDDNRPKVDEIVENVRVASDDIRAITDRARTQLMDQVETLLARGRSGLDSFSSAMKRLDEILVTSGPRIESTLADAQLTAQQLKLTSMEVRRSPWKLLYRPSDRELDHELLYDAARSFALAASELQISSTTFEQILDSQDPAIRNDPALAERLRQVLTNALTRYEQAQDALFSVLLNDPAGP